MGAVVPEVNLTAGFPTVVVRTATLRLVEQSDALVLEHSPVQRMITKMTVHTPMQQPTGIVTPMIIPPIDA